MIISSSGSVSLAGRDWTPRVIGNIPADVWHTVIFVVDVAHSTYNLSILSSSGEILQVTDQPLITANPLDFHNPANPSIHFNFSEGGGSKYIIENLTISRKDPSKK